MPRTRRAYPPEFRQQIVELHRAGRRPGELAREFEPNEQTTRNWIAQADLDEGRRRDGLTTVERAELRKLRKENRQLRVEREILAKAAASLPPRALALSVARAISRFSSASMRMRFKTAPCSSSFACSILAARNTATSC